MSAVTSVRLADLPEALRERAETLMASRVDDTALAAALGLAPLPDGLLTDGLFLCGCGAWFWAEQGGIRFPPLPCAQLVGPGDRWIESKITRVCGACYPADHGAATGEHYAPCLLLAWRLTKRIEATR